MSRTPTGLPELGATEPRTSQALLTRDSWSLRTHGRGQKALDQLRTFQSPFREPYRGANRTNVPSGVSS